MNNIFDLSGKRALVTGSARGLGYVFAKGLAQAGAKIVLNDLNEELLKEAVAAMKEEGIDAEYSVFDITDEKIVNEKVTEIEKKIGQIDILVNNAGMQSRNPMEDFDVSIWRKMMEVNLTGAFIVSQAVGRHMIPRKKGKIVNICSLLSEFGRETIVPYTASKGGIKMLTKGIAVDWAKHNIQANGIGPGYFATKMNTALVEDEVFSGWLCKRTPAGRWGEPEEMIGTLVFLASDASDFVTGQIIYVDGGITASL